MTRGLRFAAGLCANVLRCGWIIAVGACAVLGGYVLSGNAIQPAAAQIVNPDRATSDRLDGTRVPSADLTVVSWNFVDGVAAGVVVREKQVQPVWRHTFVPRVKAVRRASNLNGKIRDADVVLLQGIRSVREVRTLFPARDWKLIVSRQILKARRGRGYSRRRLPEGFGTTAVVVRYQLGLRVTGQEHLLDLIDQGRSRVTDRGGDNAVDSDTRPVLRGEAGLAVRVSHRERVIWFVSAAFSGQCLSERECAARESLAKWIEDKRDYDFPVVTGGRFRRGEDLSAASDPPPDAGVPGEPGVFEKANGCRGQDIKLDPKLNGEVKLVSDAGCYAVVVVDP